MGADRTISARFSTTKTLNSDTYRNVSCIFQGNESSNLPCQHELNLGKICSDAYRVMTYISRIIEHRKDIYLLHAQVKLSFKVNNKDRIYFFKILYIVNQVGQYGSLGPVLAYIYPCLPLQRSLNSTLASMCGAVPLSVVVVSQSTS